MLKNEYGSVQQHLEAKHIAGILIPIPPDWKDVKLLIDTTRAAVEAREAFEKSFSSLMDQTTNLLTALIDKNNLPKRSSKKLH
jgi:hypothetical protein